MTDEQAGNDQSSTKMSRRHYGRWLCFALIVCLFAGGLPVVIRYQRQIALIKHIEQIGGYVKIQPIGPDWLRNMMGEGRMQGFDKVTQVGLLYTSISDEELEELDGSYLFTQTGVARLVASG